MSHKLFTQRVGLIGVTNFLVNLSGLILLPVMTKTLSLYDYGVWVQFNATVGMIAMFALLGLGAAIVRFIPGEEKNAKLDAIFSISVAVLVFSLILSLLVIIGSDSLTKLVGSKEVVWMIALIIPLYCLNLVFLTFFIAVGQMKRYSIFLILQTYGDIFLILYLVRFGIIGVVSAILFIRIALFLMMFVFITREFGFGIPTFKRIKEYFNYSLPLIPASLSGWVISSSDRYFIAYFLGISFAGIYSPGYSLGTLLFMFSVPLGIVLTPTLAELYKEHKYDEVKRYISYSLKYILMLSIPSIFGLTILSKKLLVIITTGEIASQGYLVIPFVAIGVMLYEIGGSLGQILMLVNKTRVIGMAAILGAVANIVLNFFFVPKFGIVGAAITTLIAYGLTAVVLIYSSSKYLTIKIEWNFIIKSMIASIIMAIAIVFADPVKTLDVIIWIGIGALMYAAIFFILRGFSKEEFAFFRSLFKI